MSSIPSHEAAAAPVLIAGAGPTGLMLALELDRAGVPFRLVDQSPARSPWSRALVVQARSLELLARHGLADVLVARGRTAVKVALHVERGRAVSVELGDIGIDDTPYPFLLFVSQAETEAVLEEALAARGRHVERGVTLVDAREDAAGVTASLRHGDGRVEETRAAWLVGCDGAHSRVRRLAGLRFDGAAYEEDFVLGDVAIDWALPDGELRFLFGRGTVAVVFPLVGPRRARVVGLGSATAAAPAGATGPTERPLELAELQALVDTVTPVPARLDDPVWLARFRLHHRGVDRYRAGRLLVAGDAAHIHSPAGGQGMNTGLQDAANLGWKLGLVCRGLADAALLDSYHEERWPVGQRLLRYTDRLFTLASSRNPLLWRLRNLLAPRLMPLVLATPARRRRLFRFVSQLGIHYRGASWLGRDGGARLPDAPLRRVRDDAPSSLHALTAAPRHHLVVFGDRWREPHQWAHQTAASWRALVDVAVVARASALDADAPAEVYLDSAGEARARVELGRGGWILVRPDGYVAARGRGLDSTPLAAYFVRLCGGANSGASSAKRVTW